MDPTTALIAGLAAGAVIAIQVGAVSLLLVEASISSGPRLGVAAGMGVATADMGFAAVAAVAGGTAGALLASHETEIRLVAAAMLAAIAVHGLVALVRRRDDAPLGLDGPVRETVATQYARFLAITAANPLTIASFAAIAASLSLRGLAAGAAFAAGVGIASGAWHAVLTLTAGHAGRRLGDRARTGLAIGGRVGVLAMAVHLALAV